MTDEHDSSAQGVQGAPKPPDGFNSEGSWTRPQVASSSLTDQGRAAAAAQPAASGQQANGATNDMNATEARKAQIEAERQRDAQAQTAAYQAAPESAASYQQAQGQHAPNQTASSQTAPYQQPPYQSGPASEKKKSGKGMAFVMGLVGIVVGALLVFGISYGVTGGFSSGAATTSAATSTGSTVTLGSTSNTTVAGTDDETTAEAVSAKSMPSVVSIKVYEYASQNSGQGGYYYYGNSYSGTGSDSTLDATGTTQASGNSGTSNSNSSSNSDSNLEYYGLGSGVIISSDGYILTNYHVVESGDVFVVYFDDDSSMKATVVATDESSDLAVIKVDKTGLTAIELGDSDTLQVGEWCATIGAPFGMEKSISSGIVSALYRSTAMDLSESSDSGSGYYGYSTSTAEYAYYANMIQTDADINPGNSGGALVDSDGKLIGICVMTYSYSGSSSGVGCAIPVNYAIRIAQQLIENGSVEHPLLGVTLDDVDASTVENYDVSSSYGAYIKSVESGSSAEKAGLKAGDVVVSYNGQKITTASGLLIDVKCTILGDTVQLGIQRGGQDMTIEVTLDQASTTSTS